VIKLGLDLHARQVTECRQLDGSAPKPAQKWDPWKLLDKVEEWVKAGNKVAGLGFEVVDRQLARDRAAGGAITQLQRWVSVNSALKPRHVPPWII
jgi:hypothetical protein